MAASEIFAGFAEKSLLLQDSIARLFKSAQSDSGPQVLDQLDAAIKVGIDINVCDSNGETLLHVAIKRGLQDLLQELLKRGADPNRVQLKNSQSPLHFCAAENRLQAALLLLENHANVDAADATGKTPLMVAVDGGKKAMAHLLILKKASLDLRDNLGNSSLHFAARGGDTYFIYLLVSAGANINAQSLDGKTPLLIAAKDDLIETFKCLLRLGASLDVFGKDGESPSAANGEVKKLLATRFLMYPHWYLKKAVWTNTKSFQISFVGVALHVLFYYLLASYGWLLSSAVAGGLFFYWFRSYWPAPDERSTFFCNWTHSVFWANTLVYFYILRENDALLRPWENDLFVVVAFVSLGFVQIMEWVNVDSGFISTPPEDDAEGFFADIRNGRTEFSVCSSCRIRRPLRSKHDQYTESCVARFDHYCFFTNQAVGALNHQWFMWTLFWTWFTFGWFLRFAYHGLPSIFEMRFYDFIQHDRVLLFTTIQGGYFFYQMLQTWLMQAYFITLNYTTNEHFNRSKYEHLKHSNPFDKGSRADNFREWLTPQPPRKWFNTFYLDQLRPDLKLENV